MQASFIEMKDILLKDDLEYDIMTTQRRLATYKGQVVNVQSFRAGIVTQEVSSSFNSTVPEATDVDPLHSMQYFLNQVKQLRDLNGSTCLVPCIGFGLKNCLVLTPHYPLGTLNNFIKNTSITWEERLVLARDIAEGMCFLTCSLFNENCNRLVPNEQRYSHIMERIFLTSESIMMEKDGRDRWRCKVGDYWFLQFTNKSLQQLIEEKSNYMAPELIDNPKCVYKEECDVYCYGVVLSELATKQHCKVSVGYYLTGNYNAVNEPDSFSKCTINALSKDATRRWSFNNIAAQLQVLASPMKSPKSIPSSKKNSPGKSKGKSAVDYKNLATSSSRTQARAESDAITDLTMDTHFLTRYSFRFQQSTGRSRILKFLRKKRTIIGILCLAAAVLLIVLFIIVLRPKSTSSPPENQNKASSSTQSLTPTPTKTSTGFSPKPTNLFMQTAFPTDAVIGRMWGGAANSFLFAVSDSDQDEALSHMVNAELKLVRVVIRQIDAKLKASSSIYLPDVEDQGLGIYNDTILDAIDKLMVKVKKLNLKMTIALHDNQCLGEYCFDAYGQKTGSSKAATFKFYSNKEATEAFDKRMEYLAQHKNPYMADQPWSQLADVIWSFDIQNKPLRGAGVSYMPWLCDRATKLRSLIHPNIHITSSQSALIDNDVQSEFFTCKNISINGIVATSPATLSKALILSQQYSKPIMVQDFWAPGFSAAEVNTFLSECNRRRIPWVLWGFSKPGLANEYEFYVYDVAKWQNVVNLGNEATQLTID